VVVPRTVSSLGDTSGVRRAWNNLQLSLRAIDFTDSFTGNLKTFLFAAAVMA